MRYIKNRSTNPYFNLALDEYALKELKIHEDFFMLWQNEPSVIIGKNQNTIEEINRPFIESRGIHVARRVSGGGAVYHDLGNLNFTFITAVDNPSTVNYKKYVQPIIDALKAMNVHAEASGRNDILIDGKKISGNAQRMANGKLMHHGTLIFNVNLEDLVQALHVDSEKFVSKGVKSVRSRVTTIQEHLPKGTTLEMFWNELHYHLSNRNQDKEIVLSPEDISRIEYEAANRFATWNWIYGTSPQSNYQNAKRYPGGMLEVLMDIQEGKIQSIRFRGDFLGLHDVSEVEHRLEQTRFHRSDIEAILTSIDLTSYFGSITLSEILDLMFA